MITFLEESDILDQGPDRRPEDSSSSSSSKKSPEGEPYDTELLSQNGAGGVEGDGDRAEDGAGDDAHDVARTLFHRTSTGRLARVHGES